VLVYGYYVFPKPSVQGFSTTIDPADRRCRYLVQPPTVPCLARLRGYQRPPRGGRGRCRRACERTPLRGRRRCAARGWRRPPYELLRAIRAFAALAFALHLAALRQPLERRPEGGALAGQPASPHLPVVGAGNPVAVSSLTRQGAKRAGTAIHGINSCRESLVRRPFE
jgi:hypothetical protein